METDCAAVTFFQRRKISERLRLLEHAERVRLARNLQVCRILIRQLNEEAVFGAAFVQLPRRMQKSWAIARGRCYVKLVAQSGANLTKKAVVLVPFLNVSEERYVIIRMNAREMRSNYV